MWQEASSAEGLQWTAQNQHHPPWGFLHPLSQALGPEGSSPKGFSISPFPFRSYQWLYTICVASPPCASCLDHQGKLLMGPPILTKPLLPGPRTHPQTTSRSCQSVFVKSCHGSHWAEGADSTSHSGVPPHTPNPASCFLEPKFHFGTSLLMASQMPSHKGGHLGEEK